MAGIELWQARLTCGEAEGEFRCSHHALVVEEDAVAVIGVSKPRPALILGSDIDHSPEPGHGHSLGEVRRSVAVDVAPGRQGVNGHLGLSFRIVGTVKRGVSIEVRLP